MTSFNLQSKSASSSFTNQNKNSTSFSLQTRDMGQSKLLDEAGEYLATESGSLILLEQSVQGDGWVLQNKS